jgi:hypothetical protein
MPTADELKSSGSVVSYWTGKVRKEEKAHAKWRKSAEEAEDVYFDQQEGVPEQFFNLFYSTVNTQQSRLFSRPPVPDVRRRFDISAEQPGALPQAAMMAKAAKDAAVLTERAISFTIDTTAFFTNGEQCVQDFLVAGAGVPRLRYKADVAKDADGNPLEIRLQEVWLEHTSWRRFHWEPSKCWEDCDWVGFDDYLTRYELKQQFNQEAETSGAGQPDKDGSDETSKYSPTYRVTTIYYRPTRTIYVIGWDFEQPLKVYRDELNLQGFYPCPRPMFANVKSRELSPMPDYWFSRKSYAYINRITQRIHLLTQQIKDVGFYDAGMPELAELMVVEDGKLVPVNNLMERLLSANTADFSKVIAKLPLHEKVQVVTAMQNLLMAEKARLDEQNGIADIIRGTTDPNETMGAQQIKANWASLRLSRKMGEIQRCFRDCFRIMTEIMGEHFTPETLFLMTGIQPRPEVIGILKSDVGRNLAIDVETDSTVAMEDEQEKGQRLEFLNYISGFVRDVLPAMTNGMLPADLGKEMLKFAVGSFKHGRSLEDAIEAAPGTAQQLQMMQQQMQQQTQQIEQMQKALQEAQGVNAQAEAMKAQEQMQSNAVKGAQAQASMASTQQKAANDAARNEIDAYTAQTDRAAVLTTPTTTVNVQ